MTTANFTKFCSACGNGLVATAAFCPACGSPVAGGPLAQAAPTVKTKKVAVILAVFLGYWSWLYTAKQNLAKFFIGLGVSSVGSVIAFSAYGKIAQTSKAQVECYTNALLGYGDLDICNVYQYDYTPVYIGLLIGLGVSIWAIVDNARKPESFFTNYPNEK